LFHQAELLFCWLQQAASHLLIPWPWGGRRPILIAHADVVGAGFGPGRFEPWFSSRLLTRFSLSLPLFGPPPDFDISFVSLAPPPDALHRRRKSRPALYGFQFRLWSGFKRDGTTGTCNGRSPRREQLPPISAFPPGHLNNGNDPCNCEALPLRRPARVFFLPFHRWARSRFCLLNRFCSSRGGAPPVPAPIFLLWYFALETLRPSFPRRFCRFLIAAPGPPLLPVALLCTSCASSSSTKYRRLMQTRQHHNGRARFPRNPPVKPAHCQISHPYGQYQIDVH